VTGAVLRCGTIQIPKKLMTLAYQPVTTSSGLSIIYLTFVAISE
jgi:hypothetical protein